MTGSLMERLDDIPKPAWIAWEGRIRVTPNRLPWDRGWDHPAIATF